MFVGAVETTERADRSMDAFDADVLIYAAEVGHPLGARVRAVFNRSAATTVGIGSVLLLIEVLSRPMRQQQTADVATLSGFLGRLDLQPVSRSIAAAATTLAAQHNLRAADAVHLATAVDAAATRFITNNRKDFPKTIADVEIVYPEDLPDPADTDRDD